MSQQTINIGTSPNDGSGDSLRVAGQKINTNFSEVYAISQNAYNQANTATYPDQASFDTANAAFSKANTAANTAQSGYNLANTNAITAQAGFNQANTANITAQSGFDKANTANTTAQSGFNQANTANTTAQSGFNQANTANITAQAAYNKANTANTWTVNVRGNEDYIINQNDNGGLVYTEGMTQIYSVIVPDNGYNSLPVGTRINLVTGDYSVDIIPMSSNTEVWGAGYNASSVSWNIPARSTGSVIKLASETWIVSGFGLANT